MSGFKGTTKTGIAVYVGDPHCDTAHSHLLQALKRMRAPFLPGATELGSRRKGNLGEFVALHVALSTALGTTQKHIGNALQPLSAISGPGLDLAYVHFDPISSANDRLYIQEIKTTASQSLSYFDHLYMDYDKLFATDMQFTLQTRIGALANKFELEMNNDDYADRVMRLGTTTPQSCVQVHLLPTGVHDLNSNDPVVKMVAIKSSIMSLGWSVTQISPWAIGISDLESRFLRLLQGSL